MKLTESERECFKAAYAYAEQWKGIRNGRDAWNDLIESGFEIAKAHNDERTLINGLLAAVVGWLDDKRPKGDENNGKVD